MERIGIALALTLILAAGGIGMTAQADANPDQWQQGYGVLSHPESR
jgi:hypothetical protein